MTILAKLCYKFEPFPCHNIKMDKDIKISFCLDSNSGLLLPSERPFKTSQGHLRATANVTTAGVLKYMTTDGSVMNVLRHPDQVFHPKSLESLSGIPITISHPMKNGEHVPVTPDNFRNYGHGVVGDEIEVQNPYVRIKGLNVQTTDAMKAIEHGNKQLSPGYFVARVPESGTFDNQPYDHRQYGINVDSGETQDHIQYNHLAIMNAGELGRSGEGVKVLGLDSAEVLTSIGIQTDKKTQYFDLATNKITKGKKKMGHSISATIKGITHNFNVDDDGQVVSIPADLFTSILNMVANPGQPPMQPSTDPDDPNNQDGMMQNPQMQVNGASSSVRNPEAGGTGEGNTKMMADPSMMATTGLDSVSVLIDSYNTMRGELAVLKTQAEKPTIDSVTIPTVDAATNERVSLVLDGIRLLDKKQDEILTLDSRTIKQNIILAWDSAQKFDNLPDQTIDGMYRIAKTILEGAKTDTKKSAEKLSLNADAQAKRSGGTSQDDLRNARSANRNRWNTKKQA